MRPWMALPFLLLLAACTASEPPAPRGPLTGTLPGDRLPSFTATVLGPGGAAGPFDLAARKGTTVLVVVSTTCPYCAEAVEPLKRAESTFQGRGVDFVYLYPMTSETPDQKKAWHAEKGFRGGLVVDAGAAIAKSLRADKTPTAYVVDGKGTLIYRGAVIEANPGGGPVSHPLADALDEHLAGKAIAVPSVEPAG